uniref:Uncharacterized protein n=1 Tax=Rhizophora mucronata TaxID=61149 RepID=A0A2P2QED8_RHIMU
MRLLLHAFSPAFFDPKTFILLCLMNILLFLPALVICLIGNRQNKRIKKIEKRPENMTFC